MSQVFKSLATMLSELDVLLSFADLASSCPTPYTRPDIKPPVNTDNHWLPFVFLALISFLFFFSFLKDTIFHSVIVLIFVVIGCGRYYIRRKQASLCGSSRLGEFYTK